MRSDVAGCNLASTGHCFKLFSSGNHRIRGVGRRPLSRLARCVVRPEWGAGRSARGRTPRAVRHGVAKRATTVARYAQDLAQTLRNLPYAGRRSRHRRAGRVWTFGPAVVRFARRRTVLGQHGWRTPPCTLLRFTQAAGWIRARSPGRTGTAGHSSHVTDSDQVGQEEKLGRGVFSSRHRDRARRARVPHHVFLERPGVTKISVDRLDSAPPDEAVAIADEIAAARSAKFHGWEVITARQAGVNGRQVRASARLHNPYHADIVLPDLAAEDREEQKRHAQELADRSSWRERSSAAPERS